MRSPDDFNGAFEKARQHRPDALIEVEDPLTNALHKRILEFAAAEQLPSLHGVGEEVKAGGLISYGASISDLFRRAAGYVDKILKGAKPADLPVEQPSKFELVINLKTAMALGITIPPAVLGGRTTSSIRHARPTRQPLRAAVVCEFRAQPSQSHVVALPRCFPES